MPTANSIRANRLGIYLRDGYYAKIPCPTLHVYVPEEYTVFDVIQIIKLLTGYSNKYKWKVFFTLGNYQPHNQRIIDLKGKKVDEIRLSDFYTVNNTLYIHYGPIKININNMCGNRSRLQTKKYPLMYNRVGRFPTEDEYKKHTPIENLDRLYKKEELTDLDEILKVYFKDRYKNPDGYKCSEKIKVHIG